MQVERHRWYSPALGQEMECELYGHAGRPVLAFPSQDGRVGDFAGFGMVDACGEILEAGRMRLVAVDGIRGYVPTCGARSSALLRVMPAITN